jgi:hypothetical protein
MIAISSGVPVYVIHGPVAFNRGIDGMRGLCFSVTRRDPIDQGYFLFINKGRNQLRIIWYDGQGFLLCTKRLSKGTYKHWPKCSSDTFSFLEYFQAQGIFCGASCASENFHPIWKKVTHNAAAS